MTPQPHHPHRRASIQHLAVRRSAIVLAAGLLLAGAPLVARALGDEGAAAVPVLEVASPLTIEPSPAVEEPTMPALLDLGAGSAEASTEPEAAPEVEPELPQPVEPSVATTTEPDVEAVEVIEPTATIATEMLLPGPDASQWAALRDCESGGDYTITNPSGKYRGAYQFDRTTWDSVASRHAPALVGVDPAAASPSMPSRQVSSPRQ